MRRPEPWVLSKDLAKLRQQVEITDVGPCKKHVKITIDRGQQAASALSVGLSVETEVAVGKRGGTRIAGADEK